MAGVSDHAKQSGADSTRGEIYQSLLSGMGNYRPVWVQNQSTGEVVHALDDEALKQAVTWAIEGDRVSVLCHHVWGVGGGPTAEFEGTQWKHRTVRWDPDAESGWTVETESGVYGHV